MTRIALPLLFLASIAVAQTSPLAQYRAAASSLTDAKAAVQSAQSEFATCKNGRLQLAFATSLPKLEGARRNFEKSRTQAERARQDLEATRRRIEAARAAKHGIAEREAAEARYATRLVEEYETPMATVAAAVEDYRGGMVEYAGLMKRYAAFCSTTGITDASARTFVKELEPLIDGLAAHAEKSRGETKAPARDVSARE
ncbi:MAG: hypothetical protein JNM69_13740 [Archangium sp.]|nr:hypothetical protein [Archangium sp.]